MDISIKYSREEVDEIILEHHVKKFGFASDGEKWVCSEQYGAYRVENAKEKEQEGA